jgi:hypothetical protein
MPTVAICAMFSVYKHQKQQKHKEGMTVEKGKNVCHMEISYLVDQQFQKSPVKKLNTHQATSKSNEQQIKGLQKFTYLQ